MSSFDLKQLCADYWFREAGYRAKDEIDLNNIKIKVTPAKWTKTTPVAQAQRGPVRTVSVKFDGGMREVISELKISKTSGTVAEIFLTSGILKGLEGKSIDVTVPYEVPQVFSNKIKINFNKSTSIIKKRKQLSPPTSVYKPNPFMGGWATARATITSQESCYKGRFNCQATLSGNVLFPSGNEQVIKEILRGVRYFSWDENPTFTVEGEGEFRWDEPDIIKWSSSRSIY